MGNVAVEPNALCCRILSGRKPTSESLGMSVMDRMIGQLKVKCTETGAHKVLRAKLFFNCDGVRESRNSALLVKAFTVVCERGVAIPVVVDKRLSISATVLE